MKCGLSPHSPASPSSKSAQNSGISRPSKSSVKRRSPVRRMSERRKSEYAIYRVISKAFLSEHPKCHRCGQPSDCVHHVCGRGKNYLEVETWIAVCDKCHAWIHSNPKKAQAKGLLAGMGKWMAILLMIATTAMGQTGGAYWYGNECANRRMANNRIFDPSEMTCASWFHPLWSKVLVTRMDVNPPVSIIVTVTDRGPARRLVRTQNRVIDLSQAAFNRIADTNLGHVKVTITRIRG